MSPCSVIQKFEVSSAIGAYCEVLEGSQEFWQ